MRGNSGLLLMGAAIFLGGCTAANIGNVKPVQPTKLTIGTASLPSGTVGVAYSDSIVASGGTTPYKYSAAGLPGGLAIAGTTGAIAGTPTSAGNVSVTIAVTDSGTPTAQTATAVLPLDVAPIPVPPLTVSTNSLPSATAGSPYSATVLASGGAAPYTFAASGLPSGLTIGSSTGIIAGTPALVSAGTYTVVVTATDSSSPTVQNAAASFGLLVNPAPVSKLTIATSSLPAGTVGSAYNAAIAVSGGTMPYAYSASGLPAGLAVSPSTGAITGTPSSSGNFTVAISVTDSTAPIAQTATVALGLAVNPAAAGNLAIVTSTLPSGTVGAGYSAAIAVSGGTAPYTYSATGLPSGLIVGTATGAISGTPTQGSVGTYTVAITVTDSTQPTAQSASADLSLTVSQATAGASCSGMSTGASASLNGFVPFPSTNVWNTDISAAPLDPNNTAITAAAGFAGLHLHHDFSSVAGGNYGIPYVVVDSSTTPLVPINVVSYASQSDVAKAPFPLTAPIEGSPADCTGGPNNYQGDQHVLVLDRNKCMLYETFNTVRCKGSWASDSETIWDMQNYEQRPWGWTSADAAGLPIFPGLLRYDEVAAGAVNHAIRFTMQVTKNDANGGYFVYPASHAAGVYWGVSNVMGMRIRLKSSFDISGFSSTNQVILTAMKKYGMILADNGGYFYFQGVADPRWNDSDLINLDGIQSSNFEVVQMTPVYPGYDSATAPTGAPPTINSFTASASTVSAGKPVTLQWSTANDTYDFIDVLGGVRGGSVSVTPTATTTYTLNATNQYGRSTAQVTVKVQ